MVTPTLFDIEVITSLRPTGSLFDPSQKKDSEFSFANAGLDAYIKDHEGEGDISHEEHIAFLICWLSLFSFCLGSLQVAKKFTALATNLHEKENISLRKLLLASFYESLKVARVVNFFA